MIAAVSATPLSATDSLQPARHAQALLGREVWSTLLRIENRAPSARYPRVVHALVFELAGMLWFYDAAHGTQSFSLHRGRLAEEKADFAPLLRDIDPGFLRWTEVPARIEHSPARGSLPNGCFIESVAALRDRLAAGEAISHPQLLSYYLTHRGVRTGHTVLAYETNGRVAVIDPARDGAPLQFPSPLAGNALQLARAVAGNDVVTARWVQLEPAVQLPAVATERRVTGDAIDHPPRV
ncbi:hypothetical protein [Horticoccus sp. 23ND18S-11]|uniref:hypothetical protein n=1 Tax=Horticoccus sp. 23ND18S-11 TaxID=3391832 RepID=UPI0039C976B6